MGQGWGKQKKVEGFECTCKETQPQTLRDWLCPVQVGKYSCNHGELGLAAQKLPGGTRLVPENFQKELPWCLEVPRMNWLCGLGAIGEGYKGAKCCCGVCLTACTEQLLWDKDPLQGSWLPGTLWHGQLSTQHGYKYDCVSEWVLLPKSCTFFPFNLFSYSQYKVNGLWLVYDQLLQWVMSLMEVLACIC